jgi:phospholipid/cholesterol/gamma-HCH transport system substrate-binding protein
MKPFRERNPIPIGLISFAVIIGLLAFALEIGNIPFLGGGGTSVHAYFADASGLQKGDNVTVGGVDVGTVKSIDIQGNHVDVGFTVDPGVHLGPGSRADIKIETLLGKMYVAVTPDNSGGNLTGAIPESRTTTPLDVTDAFIGLGRTAGSIDKQTLAKSFHVLSAAFKGTPAYVRSSLRGLSRLSQSISSRNAQIGQLLSEANSVTGTLAARDAQISKLIDDSNLVLRTVEQQAAVIHRLLIDTTRVARQLSGLVTDNERVLGPALARLHGTIHILEANQANLKKSIRLAAPFIRDFTDVLGTGRYFESILQNLPSGLGTACYHLPGVPVTCTGGKQ